MLKALSRPAVATLAMLAIAQCLPLWQHYWFSSHEYWAYPVRVVEFQAALRRGELYPRWAADFYGGYGSPFFVFYAPLTFAMGAVLSSVLGSAVLALKVWIVIAAVAAALGVYAVVQTETLREDAAILSALFFLGSPYRLTEIFVRGDIAEYTAISLLPWAIWAYRRIGRALPFEDTAGRALLAVALHGSLVFSHAILAMWGTLLLALVCAVTTLELAKRRALAYAAPLWVAFGLALAISGAYTGPALLEKSAVQIGPMTTGYNDPSNQLLPVRDLLGTGQFGLLPVVILALVLSIGVVAIRARSPRGALWALGAGCFALLSTSSAEAFWLHQLPLTSFIQFPWRLHGLGALTAAIGAGVAWGALFRLGAWSQVGAVVLGGVALLVSAPLCHVSTAEKRGSFPETPAEMRRGIYHTSGHEYLPVGVKSPPTLPAHSLIARTSQVVVKSDESVGNVHELEVVASEPGTAELRLHMFPGWTVDTLEGPGRAQLRASDDGLVEVQFPAAGRYRARVRFGHSRVRLWFELLAGVAALATWPVLRTLARSRIAMKERRAAIVSPRQGIAA